MVRSDGNVLPLAATLGALIEGVTAGLVGHAVVVAPGGEKARDILRLAEATGADLLAASSRADADWRAAAGLARGEWLLFLEAGEMFESGWPSALERHAIAGFGRPARALRGGLAGLLERAFVAMRPARPASGVIMAKEALLGPMARPSPALALPLRRRRLA